MVFVILGNQNFQFNRLLDKIESMIKSGFIKEDVIAQIGHTSYKSSHMQTIDFLSKEEFNMHIEKATFIISHAGTGSLFSSIKRKKKVLAAARLEKHREHIDDHQKEILEAFVNEKLILGLNENLNDFEPQLLRISNFTPKEFKSNNAEFNSDLMRIIEEIS